MDFPIEPERLLGLGRGAAASDLEAALFRRLTPPAWGGLSTATLEARAAWLQCAADQLRGRPTRPVQGGAALVAAWMLELEQGDAREMVRRLEPFGGLTAGQAAAEDLTPALLAHVRHLLLHAARSAAQQLVRQRRFEAADRLLRSCRGNLASVAGSGRLDGLDHDRQRLVPYRILDLLSRELGDGESRSAGLALLNALLEQRGGLDGPGDGEFDARSFAKFLLQIRSFLTIQEWIDCLELCLQRGDPSALEPMVEALVASGFLQRKPARVQKALDLLGARSFLVPDRRLACLHLLLGEIEVAQAWMPDPGGAAGNSPDGHLEALCEMCRSWLAQGITAGYRDTSTALVDLPAWFADRTVLTFLEQRGTAESRPGARPAWDPRPRSGVVAGGAPSPRASRRWSEPTRPAGQGQSRRARLRRSAAAAAHGLQAHRSASGGSRGRGTGASRFTSLVIFTMASVLGAGLAVGLQRLSQPQLRSGAAAPVPVTPSPPLRAEKRSLPRSVAVGPPKELPVLQGPDPAPEQLQVRLQDWLDRKGRLLAGQEERVGDLEAHVAPALVQSVRELRRGDQQQGALQRTLAQIESVQAVARSTDHVTLEAKIRYADELLDRNGLLLGRTPLVLLRNRYHFTRLADGWKLTDWSQLEPGQPLASLSDPLQQENP
ncbi:MAG: IMS domain-containing protein [Cyanobacteriota bacterium]